ncbi:DinB family protein [Propioniciclava coleopterorum]|uniref:DinB family protein n=1 Tax=Propioniciclava coleopterorum TaxID=2714937 RepID=A0A6G7Y8X6_9ACTN|nr:DinB family protein [Propioniciclava coleopterorum]QIK73272.1 DinB family protein [Propioniciclava coleopterorum]
MNPADARTDPPAVAGEYETLTGFLDFLRDTIAWKTSGLDAEGLGTPLPPSTMTLGGMLKHLAFVEDFWVGMTITGDQPAEPFASAPWDDDPDWDWSSAPWDTPEELRALWETTVARSRGLLAEAVARNDGDLLTPVRRWNSEETLSLRWILTHLIEEYARHAGHADLLRENVDGSRGE